MIYVSDKEIKAFMAKRRRELATVKRSFPKYRPGMSTADYINAYAQANGPATRVLPFDVNKYAHPATVPSGPEVIEEVNA
jgi:hypothetical protein